MKEEVRSGRWHTWMLSDLVCIWGSGVKGEKGPGLVWRGRGGRIRGWASRRGESGGKEEMDVLPGRQRRTTSGGKVPGPGGSDLQGR